eukprot:TRINITY_DN3445_c0_g1_i12.p1 TRINITY_DN3445_c0_g1~~TRINITY_DN3445_c0_g1_i12.p1  ORF type:complete len:207 (-),score=-16.55 TRINITY_DN3445_c0_g1_i12:72-692(-)
MKRVPTNSNLVEFQVEKYSHAQIFCFQKVCLEQNAIKFDLSYQNVYICLLQIAKIYHKITKQFFIQQKLYNKLSFYKVYACKNIILNRIYYNLAENWQFSSFRLFYTRNYSHIKIYTISAKQTETSMCNYFLIFITELVYFFPIFIALQEFNKQIPQLVIKPYFVLVYFYFLIIFGRGIIRIVSFGDVGKQCNLIKKGNLRKCHQN